MSVSETALLKLPDVQSMILEIGGVHGGSDPNITVTDTGREFGDGNLCDVEVEDTNTGCKMGKVVCLCEEGVDHCKC